MTRGCTTWDMSTRKSGPTGETQPQANMPQTLTPLVVVPDVMPPLRGQPSQRLVRPHRPQPLRPLNSHPRPRPVHRIWRAHDPPQVSDHHQH